MAKLTLKQRAAAALKSKKANSISNKIIDGITIAFGIQNILPSTIASGGSFIEKGKSAVNELLGRTTGLNLFEDAPQFSRHFSIENALTNPQTVAGVTALIYNEISKRFKILPLKAESKRFAKKNIAVGIGTGLFGEPSGFSLGSFNIKTHKTSHAELIGAA